VPDATELRVTGRVAVVAEDLRKSGAETPPDREIVALIAYLQRLGKDIKATAKQ
jgi:cytochrome c oxidase cbb3-type subunit I/II